MAELGETLWGYCFFLEVQRARRENLPTIEFDAVDQRVLELSKHITDWKLPEGISRDE